MTWNYRVVRQKIGPPHYDPMIEQAATDAGVVLPRLEYTYAIHEVFYDDDSVPTGLTEDSVGIRGDTLDELRRDAEYYMKAFDRPVLDYETREEVLHADQE